MMIPIDTSTGLQSGSEPKVRNEIIKGYLVTLPDGHECRMGPDLTRAQNYAVQQRARSIEPMYVRRGVHQGGAGHTSEGATQAPGAALAGLSAGLG